MRNAFAPQKHQFSPYEAYSNLIFFMDTQVVETFNYNRRELIFKTILFVSWSVNSCPFSKFYFVNETMLLIVIVGMYLYTLIKMSCLTFSFFFTYWTFMCHFYVAIYRTILLTFFDRTISFARLLLVNICSFFPLCGLADIHRVSKCKLSGVHSFVVLTTVEYY